MTQVTLYHSFLCPRCHLASRTLQRLASEFDLQIERIDATLHPRQSLQAGVTVIPCLVAGEKRLSGLLLTERKIRQFIDQLE